MSENGNGNGAASLGDRMKAYYEDRTRYSLPRRTNTIIRVDGRAFHTLTRGMPKPFAAPLMAMMDRVAVALCEEIQGAKMAFVQSDEVSVWATDYDSLTTQAWFDGNLQKICSIAAATATQAFNYKAWVSGGGSLSATFDARAFSIPEVDEVANYFVWRQQDATRNSIEMAARAVFSHKECHEKSCSQLQEMLFERGVNWNDYPIGAKRGRTVIRIRQVGPVEWMDRNGQTRRAPDVERSRWVVDLEPPIFTTDRSYIVGRAP